MEIELRKLFNGFASIRDYVVRGCIKRQEELIIWYNGEKMTVSPKLMSMKFQLHKKLIKSKFSGQVYELVDFMFISDDRRKEIETLANESRQTYAGVKGKIPRGETSLPSLWSTK